MSKIAKLVIAGPGGGKTHNMVEEILTHLPELNSSRYLVAITYTNSAAKNIASRLSRQTIIPPNVFIGTIHSFLNRFVVIPYSSWLDNNVNVKKLFIQCQIDDVLNKITKGRTVNYKQRAAIRSRLSERLKKSGYISYDQTLLLSRSCIENSDLRRIISNRIQFLFVDEFQDTNNHIFSVIDGIRKEGLTRIYCVGDPEQYIQSFDSSIKNFNNIPILKSSNSTKYSIKLNQDNHRSSQEIVEFLNFFNERIYNQSPFQQRSIAGRSDIKVKYISSSSSAKTILATFNRICSTYEFPKKERCILAKKNDVIKRIETALDFNVISPKKKATSNPITPIKDTLLSCLGINQQEFFEEYKTDIFGLRKHCIKIMKAIKSGEINNENTFVKYLVDELNLKVNPELPIKIENLRVHLSNEKTDNKVIVSNIHNFKGLEANAVLAIAKTEEELNLWLEINRDERDKYRDKETTDYPRLGYVAFSRARNLLCISCLQLISQSSIERLKGLNVEVV